MTHSTTEAPTSPTMTAQYPSMTEYEVMNLVIRERTGREIAKLYETYRDGDTISYGTLYSTLRRLKNQDWIDVKEAASDRRLRKFKLTGTGKEALSRARERHLELAEFYLPSTT